LFDWNDAMAIDDNFRAHVDRLLLDGNLGLALAPRLDESADALGGPSAEGGPGGDAASFQVALGPVAKAAARAAMRASGAQRGFDRTVGRLTGGEFNPDEIRTVEDRALNAAKGPDIPVLTGIGEGPPVVLNANQKAVIDRLLGQAGSDPLGDRVRAAYGKALNAGQIRVR
jgi:hypothetical protein